MIAASQDPTPKEVAPLTEKVQTGHDFSADPRAQYEAATKGLLFAKDFHTALEALMMDSSATYGQRFLAWLKRRSWGNYRLYAVLDNGDPATQADCSRELGITKQAIWNVVNFYELRGYLYREGKRLYPVISPQLSPLTEKVQTGHDFLEFLEHWKVTQGSDFSEWEVAKATVKRIELVRLGQYKQWLKARTNGGASLLEILESKEEREETSSSSSSLLCVEEPEQETTTTIPGSAPIIDGGHLTPSNACSAAWLLRPSYGEDRPDSQPVVATHSIPEPDPSENLVVVLTEVLTEALQSHPIGGMPSHDQVKELVPLLPAGAAPEVIRQYGTWLKREKLATGKLKSVGGLQAFTREFARIYVRAPPPKKPTRPAGCPKCGRLSTVNGRCMGCGTVYLTRSS